MFQIPTADDLVTFIKDFTGSSNDAEIKKCIFMAELSMRNIELPALRSDPYAVENIGVADENGRIPIPGDMNKPILFFKQGSQYTTTATCTGTSGTNTITLQSAPAQSLQPGMYVTGTNIAPGCVINAVSGGSIGSVITLSLNNIGTVNGLITFTTVSNSSSQTGPWIVYDRIGDRDIITQGMIAQLYLQPVNVPAVIRGKFSEVYDKYQFLPYVAQGDLINMYYYRAWPLLFAPIDDVLVDISAVISGTTGTTATLTVNDSSGVMVGDILTATAGSGSFGATTKVTVTAVPTGTTITIAGTGITNGTVTNVYITDQTVQNNAVLATWAEGYVYSTLREYYIKRHNPEDAQVYATKYENAWNIVEDQNNLGKWSGGHTRLTSVWQPRQYRQYNIK
jgi:hypothetical protein